MQIKYWDKVENVMTVACFERHTMSRTMRRYPSRRYEYVSGDFSARPVRLVGMSEAPVRVTF